MIAKQRDDDSTKLAADDRDLLHRQIKVREEEIRKHYRWIRENAYLLGRLYERERSGY